MTPPFTNIGQAHCTSKQKVQANYVKGVCVHFHPRRYSCRSFAIVEQYDNRRFLQAFRRLANRRGMAKVIHSDDLATFHKAAKVFKASTQRMRLMTIDPTVVEDKLANQGVSWKFITARASHRGGHWKRVCRQLKEPLRKMLGKAFLNYTEMMTVLRDIEAIREIKHDVTSNGKRQK